MSYGAPRGTNDVLPDEIERWHKVEDVARRTFARFGYGELRTPIFEHTELFSRGLGDATDVVEKEMYTFSDRSGRSLTLRPEGTAPAARAYVEHHLDKKAQPVKLYYIGPMFRYERPQAGRYRQHYQMGAEVIGAQDPSVDVELILLLVGIYKELGLDGFEVQLNSIGCPVCRPAYREKLKAFLAPHIDEMCVSCKSRYERNPMRILDCKKPGCRRVTEEAPAAYDSLCDECTEHFATVMRLIEAAELPLALNRRLVRGFDYYTKTVFEVTTKHLGAQDAVGGGGRYDGLVEEIGGTPAPAAGFASGLERVLLALEHQGKSLEVGRDVDLFVVAMDGSRAVRERAFLLGMEFRRAGLRAELDYLGKSEKAQMKAANRLAAKRAVLIGDDELNRGVVIVRNMESGEQHEVHQDDLPTRMAEWRVTG